MGSLYWRQFMLGAGMVLLTMVLLGVSFYALSYNYTVSEKRSEMRDRANLIAQLSVSYLLPSDEAAATQEDALRALAGVASRMTDVDFLICNRDGDVLLTSDAGLVGKSVRVPEEIVTRTFAEGDGYEGRSTVGVYEQKKFVVGVPMTGEDGAVLGLVLAVMDGTALMEMWRSFIGLFFMLSAIILLVAFVASSVTSMKQIKPITEMVQATRAYADGNFDVRMQETSSGGEIGELAASVFQDPQSQFFTVNSSNEVAFGLENHRLPQGKIRQRVDEAFRVFHLERLKDRNVYELSSGERQLISILSAWAMDTDIFLLDEPTANLDFAATQQLKEILLALKKQGKTLLLSEHRLYYLADIADEYWVMADGEIKGKYTAAEAKAFSIHHFVCRPVFSHKAVVPTGIFVPEALVFSHLCHSFWR